MLEDLTKAEKFIFLESTILSKKGLILEYTRHTRAKDSSGVEVKDAL